MTIQVGELSYGDKIFKLLQGLERKVNVPDLHSFVANVKNGVVFVEARQGEAYIRETRKDATCVDWAGNYIAAANRLEMLRLDLDSVEI